MLAFCLTITEAMSEVPMIESGKVSTVEIMDDWYLAGNARGIAIGWPDLEATLAKRGHILQARKSSFWAPALDRHQEALEGGAGGRSEGGNVGATPPDVAELRAFCPQVFGGLPLLGAALQGQCELSIGSAGRIGAKAKDRAQKAVAVCRRLELFIAARPSVVGFHVAWTILQKCVIHALDFDARLCPSWALREARGMLDGSVAAVVDALAGKSLDYEARVHCASQVP